jgi:hypothetical protein
MAVKPDVLAVAEQHCERLQGDGSCQGDDEVPS